ncbi:TPA: DUF268 domain-containing protein [Campylobacter jejuni]|nr:DUF268 domain-containing protein [Campylobacter jejuni]
MSREEFEQDKIKYEALNKDIRFILKEKHEYFCPNDKYSSNSLIGGNYFVQDIWGARKVLKQKPEIHYDIGSSTQGFIAHLMAFHQKTVLIDIRVQDNKNLNTNFLNELNGGLTYLQSDATNLENIKDESLESLSALCSVEHFGLGRYGDSIDPEAWKKALKAFQRVLKPGGKLFFSVPIGKEDKVCFNAHRVFNPMTIIENLDQMCIDELSYISDLCETRMCIFRNNEKVIFDHDILKNIPDSDKGGPTGLFEFTKQKGN